MNIHVFQESEQFMEPEIPHKHDADTAKCYHEKALLLSFKLKAGVIGPVRKSHLETITIAMYNSNDV